MTVSPEHARTGVHSPTSSDAAKPVRLLLADDHTMLREGLRRSMETAGFQVVGEAGDGGEAVDLALSLVPDVTLMDVSMPVLDGVEATRQIHRSRPEIQIVMLTMHADADIVTARAGRGCGWISGQGCFHRGRRQHRADGRLGRHDPLSGTGRFDVERGAASGQPATASDRRCPDRRGRDGVDHHQTRRRGPSAHR